MPTCTHDREKEKRTHNCTEIRRLPGGFITLKLDQFCHRDGEYFLNVAFLTEESPVFVMLGEQKQVRCDYTPVINHTHSIFHVFPSHGNFKWILK